ncbi:MAG: 2-C-methyl-D-erythritol 4-phosphate cytidylyltransferase [Xanthomonadales bacterium]|nr:2-C-methyl-D-erythritol 4-phosphate cytidylyltransferase [Xanthomonadales bacterium]
MSVSFHALIVAAGKAQRFGGALPKQYVPLMGKPVLAYSIDALRQVPGLRGITVVLATDDADFEVLIGSRHGRIATTEGGETRAESVLKGLDAIRQADPETSWVMVHDGARPCIEAEQVIELTRVANDHEDGAILAIPVSDTLKRADQCGLIRSDVDRDGLWAAQTPQLFQADRLAGALRHMLNSERQPTDEASAMQLAGARPRLVRGSSHNIKITWPADVALAEAVLAARRNPESRI